MKFKIVIGVLVLFLITIVVLKFLISDIQIQGILERLFYWFAFFWMLLCSLVFKLKGKLLLYLALFITTIGAIFNVLSFNIYAENIIRFSFLLWILGIVFVLFEHQNTTKDTKNL